MTVPIEPPSATPSSTAPTPTADTLRLVALCLPLTLLVLFLGLIWLIGIVVPPAHRNSQSTGRQALAMIRAIAGRS
ncbi:hypothetical protein ABH931_000139 [Streptacidiphilus sp. MAP12-33]|uniref:hypothetical protein n=1 Tax=Streptacidiphilus sp. MAP12-33 TaxID=3156266 RepID=UPI003512E721